MGFITISDEQLEKAKKTSSPETLAILNKFNLENIEKRSIKEHNKTRKKQNAPTKETLKKKRRKTNARRVASAKRKAQIEAEKLAKVRKISSRFIPGSTPVNTFGLGSATNHSVHRSSNSSQKRGLSAQDFDNDNFASQQFVRDIEYGHGRKRTAEWNNTIARNFRKELNQLRQKQKEDPNTFDRGAMK